MKKPIRQGDLALVRVTKLPKGLKKTKTNLLMKGSHNNDHTAINCDVYFVNEDTFVFGYLRAKKGAKIFHVEHSPKGAKLPVGIYQMRKQHQDTHQGLMPILD